MGISMKRRDGSLLRQAGFTLIEVMTVVAIVGVGSAIGIPSYLQWNERYQLRQVTSELRSTDFVASAPGILGAITFNQQGLRVAGGAGNQAVTLISPNGTTYTVTVTPSGKIN
jgi:prepilin-type N-terminal cleavage/methylation domain-containing protein